jgi:hypothetical protein
VSAKGIACPRKNTSNAKAHKKKNMYTHKHGEAKKKVASLKTLDWKGVAR